MNTVSPNQDVTLHTLPVIEDGGGGRRARIDHMAAGLQDDRHAVS